MSQNARRRKASENTGVVRNAERRLGKGDYFRSGMQLLAEGGINAVTIANVCARLRVTKGSFYHHFESGSAFHAELLANYEEEYAHRRIQAVNNIADPAARLHALLERAVERDHEAESALRAWSRTDPIAADVMHRVDAARTGYISAFLIAQGVSEEEAQVQADIGLALVAGTQGISRIVDRRKLRAMLEEHVRWLTAIIAHAHDGQFDAKQKQAPREIRARARR